MENRAISGAIQSIVVVILLQAVVLPMQYDQTHDEWHYSYDNVGTSMTNDVANKSITITPNGTDYDVVDENGLPIELKTWEKYDQELSIDYVFDWGKNFITQGGVDVQCILTGTIPNHYVILVAPSKTPEQGYNVGETPEQPIQIPDYSQSFSVVVVLDGVTEISSPFFSGALMENNYCKTIYLPDTPITLNQGYETFLPLNSTTGIRLGERTQVFPMLKALYGISDWKDEQGNDIDSTKMYAGQGMYEHRANETTVERYVNSADEYHILMLGDYGSSQSTVFALNKTQGSVVVWSGYDNIYLYFNGNPITLTIDQNGEIPITYSGSTHNVSIQYMVTSDNSSQYVYGTDMHVNPDNPFYLCWMLRIQDNGCLMNWSINTTSEIPVNPRSDWTSIQIEYSDRIQNAEYSKDYVLTIDFPQRYNNGAEFTEQPLAEKSLISYRHVEWDGEKSDDVMWGLYIQIMIFMAVSPILFIMNPHIIMHGIRNRISFEEEW